jgi:hypothetical protein
MIKFILPTVIYFSFLSLCNAQKVQAGFGASANNTFFHKGESEYQDEYYSRGISPGIGFTMPVNFRLGRSFNLRSGFAYQVKRYRVLIADPEEPKSSVIFNFESAFNCLEVPLILSYRTPEQKKYKVEYSLGIVNSFYFPSGHSLGYSFEGEIKPVNQGIYLLDSKEQYSYSPDLYIGIGLLNMLNGSRRHEFSISYQYGLMPTMQKNIYAFVIEDSGTREYFAKLRPTLSSFMLNYIFYPKWLNWGIVEEEPDSKELNNP